MHVVFFADQHLESLGGAQVSMRLQRRFLERAGHTVSVVAPAMHGPRARAASPDAAYLDAPSVPITIDREYAFTWPGRCTDAWIDAALRARPPVDLVHVQADFWGALAGHRFAARHGLPVVHTMHNRVDVGIEATVPFPGVALRALNGWQRWMLGARSPRDGHDGWAYLRGFAARARAVTAPSSHFARRLEEHAVRPGARPSSGPPILRAGTAARRVDAAPQVEAVRPAEAVRSVDVVWNGIDDDVLDAALAARGPRIPGPPRFVWLGRMSPEKRLLPFLEALAMSGVVADVEVLGGGGERRAAARLVERLRPAASVTFGGRLSYPETLRRMAASDAVVQTSIGFETQGMTVFEAAALGTPAIVSDPDIARELESGFWSVGGAVDVPAAHADGSVPALAAALRRAAADVEAGAGPAPNPAVAERFRQTSRTAAMLEVYGRVLS